VAALVAACEQRGEDAALILHAACGEASARSPAIGVAVAEGTAHEWLAAHLSPPASDRTSTVEKVEGLLREQMNGDRASLLEAALSRGQSTKKERLVFSRRATPLPPSPVLFYARVQNHAHTLVLVQRGARAGSRAGTTPAASVACCRRTWAPPCARMRARKRGSGAWTATPPGTSRQPRGGRDGCSMRAPPSDPLQSQAPTRCLRQSTRRTFFSAL
jgi:hypothetical protein